MSEELLVRRLEAARGKLVLVVTGAGVSLASGIPTFRGSDPGAVWANDVTEMGTRDFFERDPVASWRWYGSRFARAAGAKPNAAHHALVALERWQSARGKFLLITQNVDGLHRAQARASSSRSTAARTACAARAMAASWGRRRAPCSGACSTTR
jgi:NAD-dependent deacetylase